MCHYQCPQRASVELFDYVSASTPDDAIVAFFKPRVLQLFAGRRAVLVDDVADLGVADYVVRHKGRDSKTQLDRQTLEAACNCDPVFETERFAVYPLR